MPMSSHAGAGHRRRLLLLITTRRSLLHLLLPVLFFLLLLVDACSASRQFSTVAISHAPNATLVCALLTAGDAAAAGSKLHCTSLPDGQHVVYPSADIPYNAIAAGTDFLCGLMSPAGGHAAMRWWSFSAEAAANRSRPVGRRLYWGPSLRSLNAGGSHVCGLSDDHDPACWEWPGLNLPKGLNFSRIALGQDFLCGVDARDNASLLCFGEGMKAPALNPATAALKAVAAGHSHACAVDEEGGFGCWGDGVPEVPLGELPESMLGMALGNGSTCVLGGDGRVRCWGGVQVPAQYAGAEFLAVEADGDAVCGILSSNYSVVCWGRSDRFGGGGSLVYNSTMPGACTLAAKCPCGFIAGTGALCGNGGGEGADDLAVCSSCPMPLNASRILIANGVAGAPGGGGDGGGGNKKKTLVVALSAAGAGAAVLAAAGAALYVVAARKRKRDKKILTRRLGESSSRRLCRDVEAMVMPAPEASPARPARPLGCEEFTLRDLSRLTNGFADDKKIGCGSFGSVYRAKLPDGREVAIKRAERCVGGGGGGGRRRRRFDAERAFRAELRLLSRVNHRNLVQLLGFCEERGERILVFEFMPHGALHDHLHGSREGGAGEGYSPLFASWEARLRVALDAARGVEYLHCYAVPPIIHRDVKPSNILLDGEWTAKVSDFGLSLAASAGTGAGSRSGAATAAAASSSATAGTVGYIDPEYYRLQELTERSDVYSFGVVLLELVTGRKAIHRTSQDGSGSPRNVIEFAVPAVERNDVARILDDRVPPPRGHEVEAVARVAKIAAECVRQRGRVRPVMSEVVAELEWAVTLCEESVVAGNGAAATSSRHGGSDVSRSESDDPSPFHTRELGFGFGFGLGSSRPAVSTHGRSHSTM